MERLDTEDGQLFVKSLASFIRQHEKALANSLQLSVRRKHNPSASTTSLASSTSINSPATPSTSSSSLSAAFSFAGLNFMSHTIKPAQLTLTPHHLFYLLSRLEDLDIAVGPLNVRLENIHHESSHSNYVSFLQYPKAASRPRSDKDSIHSVSSARSVMSGMNAFWSTLGFGSSSSTKSERAKTAIEADLKYLYSAFTKLPSLRLSPDHRARLIKGYEEFPFDTAVPLFAFKNVQQLDLVDVDFRQFFGWDRLAEQLSLLTVKRGNLEDPTDLITNIVLDDADKRRRRSTKSGNRTSAFGWAVPSSSSPTPGMTRSNSDPGSAENASPETIQIGPDPEKEEKAPQVMAGSLSPARPIGARPASSYRHIRTYSSKAKRSGSGSSNSSETSMGHHRSESSSNLLSMAFLPPNKWQKLKYLSLADNSLHTISAKSIQPLANTLRSLNLSSNLFTEIPDSLATLTRLSSLDLSNCMIESLRSLSKCPLPAITTIKLRSNRLQSLAGVERLLSLENLNVQDNQLSDPMEAARLTCIPNLRRIWVKHNPLTRRYPDFRITIFNLFRNTPGYTEDINIEDHGPGYNERKQLVDRVPETERPAVVVSVEEPERAAPVVVHETVPTAGFGDPLIYASPRRPPPRSGQSEYVMNSARRRRGPRRRIVDLSTQENNSAVADSVVKSEQSPPTLVTVPVKDPPLVSAPSVSEKHERLSGSQDDSALALPSRPAIVASEPPQRLDRTSSADDYRHRVEALRQEFGHNWISVLGEQGWDGARDLREHGGHVFASGVPHLNRANTQIIVSGSRTLG